MWKRKLRPQKRLLPMQQKRKALLSQRRSSLESLPSPYYEHCQALHLKREGLGPVAQGYLYAGEHPKKKTT